MAFPNKQLYFTPGIDRGLVRLSEEARYSVSHWKDAREIASRIVRLLPADRRANIIDGTACVGGNTVELAKVFPHVIAVDIVPEHVDMLEHNLSLYSLGGGVTCLVGDIVLVLDDVLSAHDTNVLFLDPPWGGPDYKETDDDIYLSGESITSLVGRWHPKIDVIVLKVPNQFDTSALEAAVDGGVESYTMRKYKCVIIRSP